MTREDVIRWAREAGMQRDADVWFSAASSSDVTADDLTRFAALVAAAEREACAKVCEDVREEDNEAPFEAAADMCAAAIRARGTE